MYRVVHSAEDLLQKLCLLHAEKHEFMREKWICQVENIVFFGVSEWMMNMSNLSKYNLDRNIKRLSLLYFSIAKITNVITEGIDLCDWISSQYIQCEGTVSCLET